VVNDFIVPGRTGTIVPGVGAVHVGIARQELGVIVHAADTDGAGPRLLALGNHAIAVFAFRNPGGAGRHINQQPVEKIDPRDVPVNRLAFLVYIIRNARHVRIKHHHHEAFRALGRTVPDNFGVPVGTEAHVVIFAVYPECEFLGNRLAFFDAFNLQFHGVASCRF